MASTERYRFGPFSLEFPTRRLLRGTEPVHLTPHEYELLRILVENHDRVVEKQELIAKIWHATCVEEGNLTQNLSLLRKLLGNQADGSPYIETLPKQGYRFAAPVKPVPPVNTRWRYVACIIGILLAVLTLTHWMWLSPGKQAIPATPVVQVQPIQNLTGEPALDPLCARLTRQMTSAVAGNSAVMTEPGSVPDIWYYGQLEQYASQLRLRLYLREQRSRVPSWQYIFEFAPDQEAVATEHIRVATTEAVAHVLR